MDSKSEVTAAAALYLMASCNVFMSAYKRALRTKQRQPRRWWMLSIHRNRTRETMEEQLAELIKEPSAEFHNFLRMSITDFEFLIQKVSPLVQRRDTDFRECIPVKMRLALTLRYLATGDSYRSLHFLFRISSQLIPQIVPEVCLALIECLKDTVKLPSSPAEWLSKAEGFCFPHCVGALDGKHISIVCPKNSASEFYNYKGGFSVVLLALVDSNYCFMFADVGAQGRISDGGVFKQSLLWKKICDGTINLPSPSTLPGSNMSLPYVFVADGAFALHLNVMKPYSGHHEIRSEPRVFNEHLSRSRVVVENTFGILASAFRIFGKPIALDVNKASIVTMTCVLLHNMLRNSNTSRQIYSPDNSVDIYRNNVLVRPGAWRQENQMVNSLFPLQTIPRRPPTNAIEVRSHFAQYIHKTIQ